MKPLAEMVLAVILDLPDEDPETICHHIAMTPRQVAQALHDVGRLDLADQFMFFRRGVRPGHHRREDVAVDVEALAGESPEEVCRHLDMTPGAIARALYRAGRHDIAGPFEAADRRSRPIRDSHRWTPDRAEARARRRGRRARTLMVSGASETGQTARGATA